MRSSSKSPFLLKASAVYVTALLSCVFVFIIVCAADGFFMGGRGLFTSVWHPESKQFGILPVMAATAALMRESGLTAASLGFSRAEHLVFVVLPSCEEWLWGAALLGFGRAAGDTMIPTMLAGNAVQYPTSPLNAIRTLTAHIGLVLSSDVGGTAYYSLFAAGGVLLALSAGANLVFRAIRKDKKS